GRAVRDADHHGVAHGKSGIDRHREFVPGHPEGMRDLHRTATARFIAASAAALLSAELDPGLAVLDAQDAGARFHHRTSGRMLSPTRRTAASGASPSAVTRWP